MEMSTQEDRLYRYLRAGNPVDLDVAKNLLGIDHLQKTAERLKAILGEYSSFKLQVSYNIIEGKRKRVYRLIEY